MPAVQDPRLVLVRLLAQADRLYSLPAVAMRVVELTRDPQVDTRALKECIEKDPALTGKILRVVNSSLFGLSSHVCDLHQALALLGTKPLKLLVLGFSLPPGLFSGVSADVLARYWRRTLTRAVVARELFERLFDAPGDEAFIAGLLRDLGILLLIQEMGEPYVRLLGRVYATGADLTEREREALGFDHRQLSADLLAHWGLPDALVQAVDPHRNRPPQPGEDRPLADTVEAAEWFARLLADGRQEALLGLFDLPVGRRLCQFGREGLVELVGQFEAKVRQLADILSLALPAGRDYRDVLAEAHDQLAAAASDAVDELILSGRPSRAKHAEPALDGEVESLNAAARHLSARGPEPLDERAEEAAPRWCAATAPRPIPSLPPHLSATTRYDPAILQRLSVAVAACRQCRRPLSLLLIEYGASDGDSAAGMEGPSQRLAQIDEVWRGPEFPGASRLAFGQSGFALVLPGCERQEAVRLAYRLLAIAPGRSEGRRPSRAGPAAGVASVAMPPRNFAHQELLASADRCLYCARASGGGVVKSIEIY